MPAAADEDRTLYLLDGNSLAYRAFFALPESIATSDGRPTNAIFGFASMLVKLVTDFGVKPTIVVWDGGSSGRKEVYPDYKGHRPTQPDLLREQWPAMQPLVEAFGYTNLRVDGFEADDVIASLAERCRASDTPCMIVTGDRDAFQLIDGPVRVMATARGITETKVYDRDAVIERYDVPPEKIPDFYGLKGDTSDNIPGVPGIGDKTAAQLLNTYGDLETVLASVDQISGAKRKENLTNHADDARVSKVLATMKRDIPTDEIDLDAELVKTPDRSKLRAMFREFELRDPLRRLEEALEEHGEDEAELPRPEDADRLALEVTLGTASGLRDLPGEEIALAAAAPEIPEGELMPTDATWQFGAWGGEGAALAGPVDDPAELAEALGDRPVIAHDAKALLAVPDVLAYDTEIGAYLLDPARRGYPLAELAEERGLAVDADDALAVEAALVVRVAEAQRPILAERGLVDLMTRVELPLVRVLRAMEVEGIKLDVAALDEVGVRVNARTDELERLIWDAAGEEFVIGSPQQLGAILFDKLKLSRKRRGKTGYSTDARVLQAIRDEHEIVPLIEEYRELSKLAQTYFETLKAHIAPDTKRLHTTFQQTATATGRLSSVDPNLQNIPIRTETGREIRRCFVAEPGHSLLSVDYEQVELRVLAHIAGEDVLRQIFREGGDVHSETASSVFEVPVEQLDVGQRSKAKMVNYGIVYGLSAYGLSDRLGIGQDEAQEFIDRYLERFPAVAQFMKDAVEQAEQHGYVSTLLGRRRQIPELRARNWGVRKLGERLAVNTVIQGTAADIIKVAMVRCHHALAASDLTTRLILQIHDELLFEGPPEEMEAARELVEREMVAAADMDPPLAVSSGVGPNWLDAK